MKKQVIIFYVLVSFLCSSVYAKDTEEPSETQLQKSQVSVTVNSTEIEKKDPKLIPINYPREINKNDYKQKLLSDEKEYSRQKKGIDGNYNNLYKVFDKLLRANNLDYQNWRLGIVSQTESVNAYATSGNLVMIYSSLYDTFYDNPDALAYVLSHELAHFILGHHQITLENSVRIAQMKQAVRQMKYDYSTERFYGRYSSGYSGAVHSANALGLSLGAYAGELAINKWYKDERQLEFDADAEAVSILTRAGYNIEASKDAMEFLNTLPNIYNEKSTHPPMNFRLRNVNEIYSMLDVNELKKEGEANLYDSKVLKVKKSSDKKTIVVSKTEGKNTKNDYIPNTRDYILMRKGYIAYLDDDMKLAKDCFEKAFEVNHHNFVPALYLSYINEYEYKMNNDKQSLKAAALWVKKAEKLNPYDKNIAQQKDDILKDFKELKKNKKDK